MVTFVGKNITVGRKVFSSKSKWRRKTKAKERRSKRKEKEGSLGTASASLALEKWGRQDSNIQGHPWLQEANWSSAETSLGGEPVFVGAPVSWHGMKHKRMEPLLRSQQGSESVIWKFPVISDLGSSMNATLV